MTADDLPPSFDIVIEARKADLGGGFVVGRVLPFRLHRSVGPFVFFDHAGPSDMPSPIPREVDVRPHPHIGLATVSYLFAGQITHRDSLGVEQVIEPGAVNWMTAGRGISHSERFEGAFKRQGGALDLIQSWVALPEADEEIEPAFDHYAAATLPTQDGERLWMRQIVGESFGLKSGVKTRSPMFYTHVELQDGATIAVPDGYAERAAYVAHGRVSVEGRDYGHGQMIVFKPGAAPAIKAQGPATIMLLGGEPLGPRHIWWNFVSSRKERIEQAKAEWQAGRILLPPTDNAEFIPLPETPMTKSSPA
ncbi:MAG TPA: pirin family protein [Alphaproteobacteria bacterium]|nr:pirin family protein [Alphaproteobacteria bacterium]